ncbi:MAG TPA: RdgB/HAM1 family non-canonical purine NTP pyrophosphatase [Leptospiraceae bacterium]|nr:RdgB/HAM1 family non-canonical purine NTP pyrophosphatase [Leptospiraceae bacterium]HMW06612.1 RdgB/HAM1 family non-canonical purine NTP pyrophosphatase [Leptospiraceae bacterium]HMX32040.1 RdgB/HAM1 family non-canonical purine NTP pyrophosphatase [Leptospiraceae bacterium]HMY31197.1 RdgB/HAM1 family non-canonical purine NTP pyrophosphatase [Leptospiraceae bacterium]HMZ63316.1 RdgB/HAM1 family non-canonical purine NTP pyrophosphatase [Leptospiraceae bacterium]
MNPTQLALASNNQHKISEFKKILSSGFSLLTPKELGIEFEVEETESTFEGNAKLKSEHLFKISGIPSIADDSGICVSALNGKPGVYSARYGKQGFTDRDRTEFLLSEIKGNPDRNAYYYCCIAFTNKEGTRFFSGKCEGLLADDYDESGNGFGYDPIFIYPPLNKRFSQISAEEKNKVSHRGIALREFAKFLIQ